MSSMKSTLGDVADFINGAAFKPEDWGDEGSRIIRIQNLTDKNKPYNRTTRTVSERIRVQPGDLLVSWSATLGVFEWDGPDIAYLNQHIFRVVPDLQKVDKRYLRHALELALLDMRRHLHGATMLHVNRGEFLSTKLYLPPLPEQRRIAAILDKADALRTKRREAWAQLDRLARSIFVEMFGDPVANDKGWERQPLGNLLSGIDSGWSPVCLDRPAEAGEWGVLKLGAVTSCEFDHRANKALPSGVEPVAGIEVKPGDLLFSRKNTYELVAACAFVESTRPRLMMSDLIFRLQVQDKANVNKRFLHALLTNSRKRAEVQKLAGGSAGSMPNISKAKLLGMQVELPPIALQDEFAARIGGTRRLKATNQSAAVEADLMFAALQHRAFRGEL